MAKRKPHDLPRVELRRQRARLQLGGAVGGYLPPGAQYDYKPKSVFAEYRVLTIIFGLIAATAILYWAFWPAVAHRKSPAARPANMSTPVHAADDDHKADPVYVEPIAPR